MRPGLRTGAVCSSQLPSFVGLPARSVSERIVGCADHAPRLSHGRARASRCATAMARPVQARGRLVGKQELGAAAAIACAIPTRALALRETRDALPGPVPASPTASSVENACPPGSSTPRSVNASSTFSSAERWGRARPAGRRRRLQPAMARPGTARSSAVSSTLLRPSIAPASGSSSRPKQVQEDRLFPSRTGRSPRGGARRGTFRIEPGENAMSPQPFASPCTLATIAPSVQTCPVSDHGHVAFRRALAARIPHRRDDDAARTRAAPSRAR